MRAGSQAQAIRADDFLHMASCLNLSAPLIPVSLHVAWHSAPISAKHSRTPHKLASDSNREMSVRHFSTFTSTDLLTGKLMDLISIFIMRMNHALLCGARFTPLLDKNLELAQRAEVRTILAGREDPPKDLNLSIS